MRQLMISCVVTGLMALCGCTIGLDRIAIPLDTHVAEVGVGLRTVPLSEGWTCLRVAPFWWDHDRVLVANIAGVTVSRANSFVTLAGVTMAESGMGLSVGALADLNDDYLGLRVGALNGGERQVGAQVGLINWCSKDSYALQLGALNWNGYFWFPLVNVALGADSDNEEPQAP